MPYRLHFFSFSEDFPVHLFQAQLLKVVPEGFHRLFFGVKVNTVKAAIYACSNHADDGIHSDPGYLDTCDNPLGPP